MGKPISNKLFAISLFLTFLIIIMFFIFECYSGISKPLGFPVLNFLQFIELIILCIFCLSVVLYVKYSIHKSVFDNWFLQKGITK